VDVGDSVRRTGGTLHPSGGLTEAAVDAAEAAGAAAASNMGGAYGTASAFVAATAAAASAERRPGHDRAMQAGSGRNARATDGS